MKTLLPALLLTSVCLLPSLRADLTIVQKIEGVGPGMQSTMEVKGSKARVDAGPGMTVLIDSQTGDMISLMRSQKKFLKVPAQMAQMAMEQMKAAQASKPATNNAVTPTGRKDTISGFAAAEYTGTMSGMKVMLWLTKDLPNYQGVLKEMSGAFSSGPMAAMTKSLGIDYTSLPGFPVKTVTTTPDGREITSTILSVSTKAIPDTEFDVPADFEAMTMPNLTPPAAAGAPAVSK